MSEDLDKKRNEICEEMFGQPERKPEGLYFKDTAIAFMDGWNACREHEVKPLIKALKYLDIIFHKGGARTPGMTTEEIAREALEEWENETRT